MIAGGRLFARTRLCLVGGIAVGCVSLGAGGVSPAQGAVIHPFLSQITEVPTKGPPPAEEPVALPGKLSGATALSLDSGQLFVAEKSEGEGGVSRLDRFDASSGAFVSQIAHTEHEEEGEPVVQGAGLAVGHLTGKAVVYAAAVENVAGNPGAVALFGEAGGLLATWTGKATESGSFGAEGVRDVAVDNSSSIADWAAGDVYVLNVNNVSEPAIDVFRPEDGDAEPPKLAARLTGTEPGVPFTEPSAVAIDEANGDVFVADGSVVDVFRPAAGMEGVYEFLFAITGTPSGSFERAIQSVAVDGGEGDIYVREEGGVVVDQFKLSVSGESAEYVGRLTGTSEGPFSAVRSVAVDPASHQVYVLDFGDFHGEGNAGVIDVFGAGLVIPDVAISEPVSGLTPTSVTLRGSVNPREAGAASCEFEYG